MLPQKEGRTLCDSGKHILNVEKRYCDKGICYHKKKAEPCNKYPELSILHD